MFGTEHLSLFIVSGLLLNLTPGQDTLYIVGRTIAQGRRAGLLSVAGIMTGVAVHTLAAAFGLSAILASSARAFTIVKFAGAAYLVYLGVTMMQAHPSGHTAGVAERPRTPAALVRAGLLTNLLNPKVALFFLAFLPQFVVRDGSAHVAAFLFLGAVFIVNGTLWSLILVWGATAMSRRLRERRGSGLLTRATGALFVGLGVRLAASR